MGGCRRGRPAQGLRLAVPRRVCGIRYTPDERALRSHAGGYYDWILNGLELYAALGAHDAVVECFPTATWTRLAGPRGGRTRAGWSSDALAGLGLAGVPAGLGQDARDAIGAAVTARLADDGLCELVGGEIAVPVSLPLTRGRRSMRATKERDHSMAQTKAQRSAAAKKAAATRKRNQAKGAGSELKRAASATTRSATRAAGAAGKAAKSAGKAAGSRASAARKKVR
jgi:hypothetical protein